MTPSRDPGSFRHYQLVKQILLLKIKNKSDNPHNKQSTNQPYDYNFHDCNFQSILEFIEHFSKLIFIFTIVKIKMNMLDKFVPSAFDTLITDISSEIIKTDISDSLKRKYLAPLQQQEQQIQETRSGIIYGASYRTFFSIPTRYRNNKPIWIHYLINTGAPKTYLTKQALRALVGPSTEICGNIVIFINGQKVIVGISSHHFDCVNIIGMDFLIARRELKYCLPGMDQQSVTINF